MRDWFAQFMRENYPDGLPEGAQLRVPLDQPPLNQQLNEDGLILADLYGRHVFHRPHLYPAFEDLSLGPLNPAHKPSDWSGFEETYLGSSPSILVIDDVLSPKCLSMVRSWLLEATVWHNTRHGYLGAYWDLSLIHI